MKYYGDIPKEDRILIKELEDLEAIFDSYKDTFAPDMAAKGLTAMSHDYYQISCEEEGDRLISRAEKAYPGYFKEKIHEHAKKDEEFSQAVSNLSMMLFSYRAMTKLGFKL